MRVRLWLGMAVTATVAMSAAGALAVSGGDTIRTIAGGGKRGLGDGGPATAARLVNPSGVAVDGRGSVYISEQGNHRVRKVSPSGKITTIAGTGKQGFSGDGGPATSAQLHGPLAVAVDGQGNVYIADASNFRVRKVSPSGTITTIAGTGTGGFSGDRGQATSAQLGIPIGVAVDGRGNVYIATSAGPGYDARLRQVSRAGTITTIAGGGLRLEDGPASSATLIGLNAVAVDRAGGVYISQGLRVRKVTGGTIRTIAGGGTIAGNLDGGPATSVALLASGVAVDGKGNVYIADGVSGRSYVFKVSGGRITVLAGRGGAGFSGDGGPARAALLNSVRAVGVDGKGNVYIADSGNQRVRKVGGAAPAKPVTPSTAKLRTFVDRIERALKQSAAGRRELGLAITAGFNCSIAARTAGQRVDRVVVNRRSLLRQLAGLRGPTQKAAEALRLLRLGLQHSIQADIRYRDGFFGVGTSGCPLPPNRNFALARRSDTSASAAKRRFVAVFNPLARSVGRRTWSANEI